MQKLIRIIMAYAAAVSMLGCAVTKHKDTVGPYINIANYEFYTTVGNPVDFSHISGYDDIDGMVQVFVIDDADYNTPGVYYPVLTARDTTGNVTETAVTVTVAEDSYVENEVVDEITAKPKGEQGCKAEGAVDPTRPCGDVVDSKANSYLVLYSGRSALVRCEHEAEMINGSCEVVYTNDGSQWGYGLSDRPKAQAEKKEEEKES